MNWTLILLTFVGVNLDFFFILLLLLKKLTMKSVILGYLIGLWILLALSFFAGHLLELFMPEWVLGFLGILPIYMALKDDDEEAGELSEQRPVWTTLITYLSVCAGCNLSMFLPILTKISGTNWLLMALVLTVLSVLIIWGIKQISGLAIVTKLMNRYGEILTKLIYVGVGIYVFWDSGLISHLVRMF